jgi:hypothetical protein
MLHENVKLLLMSFRFSIDLNTDEEKARQSTSKYFTFTCSRSNNRSHFDIDIVIKHNWILKFFFCTGGIRHHYTHTHTWLRLSATTKAQQKPIICSVQWKTDTTSSSVPIDTLLKIEDPTVTLCSSLKINRRFGETRPLHFQGWRIIHATNKSEVGSMQNSFNRLHGVITTSVRTSNQRTQWFVGS